MTFTDFSKKATLGYALGIVALLGILAGPAAAQVQASDDAIRILQGFAIAPVPLNMAGLDMNLVGLGSYLVNAVGDCNGCHTGGGPPNFNYAAGRNPYFGQSAKVDPTTYLAGGSDFGPVAPPTGPSMYTGPDMISRNLTPDKTGFPVGGHTLSDFIRIIRTGVDLDNLHPTCVAISPTPTPANCIPPPVRGDLLQVMPWPAFANMTDHDLVAIYEYLRAIPCIAGPADVNDPLHNDCGTPTPPGMGGVTIVVTGPGGTTSATNTFSAVSNQFSANAAMSTSTNAGALTYSWSSSPGYPAVGIVGGNTATPTFQLSFHGTYQFTLTVTDATGAKATATITVQYT